ncbi:MAG: 30S ribosomal protein S12 methylthiotransferase RimO [Lachnospiraceae bacterium]|nr:30S ribosomal protein S12 methylthiotransferase RimO [Lachnospiraceae bacterium]
MIMNVGFVSLGCSKNLVDTEMIIGLFKNNNYNIVNDPMQAEVIVVNTCGFIESAKQEAIDTILEMAEYKEKHKCKYLIATGCLVERYKSELEKQLPEVDMFISIKEYENMWEKISKLISKEDKKTTNIECCTLEYENRIVTTGTKTAYLKIAEGCSNRCTYCAIPYIRGAYVSRTMEDILKEAKKLADSGIEELIVIAQDTTKYGIDIYGESKLAELLQKISDIKGIKWIRFLYAYPESITTELIELVKTNPKVCKYFDIPLQHISDSVLKRMNRKSNSESIKMLIKLIRFEIPNVVIRTSLIVGFPGETEEDFKELLDFVSETEFDKLGVFMYSKEDGTPAEKLPNQVPSSTKKKRYNLVMKTQKQISKQKMTAHLKKVYEVLVENSTFDNKYYVGRTAMDVPDMDGVVFVKKDINEDITGKFVNVEITDIEDYDLIGRVKSSIELALDEADLESETTSVRYTHDEVFSKIRGAINGKK